MPAKISYLISHYPAISHTFILREVLHLKSMGVDLQVTSINSPDRENNKLTQEEITEQELVYYIKQQGISGALKALAAQIKTPVNLLKTFFFALKLNGTDLHKTLYNIFYFVEAMIVAEWMKQNNSKHIHVHFASEAATVGLLVKKLTDCSYSIYVHGPDEFYNVSNYALSSKIKYADFIFCISDFAKSQLMKISDYQYWDKFIVCRLGVDTDKFKPDGNTSRNKTQSPASILCVGRLCPAKGQHILLQAAKLLIDKGVKFTLTLVGDGPDRESLESLTAKLGLGNKVEFTGSVNHDEVHQYYRQADVFCLPSFAEGIPIVLMEAMAQEIPVVTTRITGIPELIDDQQDGILTTPANIEELAIALEVLITDRKFAQDIGVAGRKKVLDKYHLENNTTLFAEKFISLLDSR